MRLGRNTIRGRRLFPLHMAELADGLRRSRSCPLGWRPPQTVIRVAYRWPGEHLAAASWTWRRPPHTAPRTSSVGARTIGDQLGWSSRTAAWAAFTPLKESSRIAQLCGAMAEAEAAPDRHRDGARHVPTHHVPSHDVQKELAKMPFCLQMMDGPPNASLRSQSPARLAGVGQRPPPLQQFARAGLQRDAGGQQRRQSAADTEVKIGGDEGMSRTQIRDQSRFQLGAKQPRERQDIVSAKPDARRPVRPDHCRRINRDRIDQRAIHIGGKMTALGLRGSWTTRPRVWMELEAVVRGKSCGSAVYWPMDFRFAQGARDSRRNRGLTAGFDALQPISIPPYGTEQPSTTTLRFVRPDAGAHDPVQFEQLLCQEMASPSARGSVLDCCCGSEPSRHPAGAGPGYRSRGADLLRRYAGASERACAGQRRSSSTSFNSTCEISTSKRSFDRSHHPGWQRDPGSAQPGRFRLLAFFVRLYGPLAPEERAGGVRTPYMPNFDLLSRASGPAQRQGGGHHLHDAQ